MAAKQFLDSTGLSLLWARIANGFAPTWKAVDLATINASATSTGVAINFQSVGANPSEANGTVKSGTLDLPVASNSSAGVITSADYQALRSLDTTISGQVPLKAVQVKNSDLTISAGKAVNIDLVYNATTRTIDLVDANSSNAVKTSVSVNDFVGDAILNGSLTEAVIVDKNDKNVSGTFLKLTFVLTEVDGGTKTSTIYANVADLVSTYTQGTGISITSENTGVDGNASSLTINIKQASTTEIGGIKVGRVFTTNPTIQTASTSANRYYPVELTSDGKAIVNVPEIPNDTVKLGTATTTSGGALAHSGQFTVVDSISVSDNTVTANKKTYTLPATPDVTVTPGTAGSASPAHGGSFSVITAIEKEGHGIKYTPTTITLPSETTLTVTGDGTDSVSITPGDGQSIKILETITGSGHTVTRDFKTITINDPDVITATTINNLAYPS